MDLEARKIEFVQQFLKVQNEEVISRFEKLLHKENYDLDQKPLRSMTTEELNRRIDQSESDFKNNRFKSSTELLEKYK
jgi:hypothetical protein